MLTRQLYHTVGLPESAIRTIQTSSAVFNEKWPFFLQVLRQLDFLKNKFAKNKTITNLYHTVGLPESAIGTIQTSSAVFNEKWPFFLQVLRQLDFPEIDLPKIRLLQTYITQWDSPSLLFGPFKPFLL